MCDRTITKVTAAFSTSANPFSPAKCAWVVNLVESSAGFKVHNYASREHVWVDGDGGRPFQTQVFGMKRGSIQLGLRTQHADHSSDHQMVFNHRQALICTIVWANDNNDDGGWPFQTLVCVGRSQLGWGTQQADETSEPVLTLHQATIAMMKMRMGMMFMVKPPGFRSAGWIVVKTGFEEDQ